jgi:thiol:disulfide interchange protein DsbD
MIGSVLCPDPDEFPMKPWIAAALSAALALPGLFVSPAYAVGVEDLLPVDQAYKLEAKAVGRERVEFTWTIAPGYYLYRHRFAVAAADASFKAGPLQLPEGTKHHDQFFGDVQTYRGSVTATVTGEASANATSASFKVKYQGCADVGVCYPPQTRILTVALPASVGANSFATEAVPQGARVANEFAPTNSGLLVDATALPENQAFKFEAIANSPSELLVRLTPAPGYYLYRDKTSFRLKAGDGVTLGAPRWPVGQQHRDEHFGDVIVYFNLVEIPLPVQRANTAAQTITLEATFQGCQDNGICYPPMTRAVDISLPAGKGAVVGANASATEAVPPGASVAAGVANEFAPTNIGLLVALLWALFGGLILNLMPCVLPVLSFKALALAEGGESRDRARAHALWYTAGVLASFAAVGMLVLGLRGAGEAMGWGFQLQQPAVVGVLAFLMFAIGLSLSGVVHFGAGMAGVGQHLAGKSGPAGDFFTGVLAVVVASPCTAPFMGAALGYAFTAPMALALLVFLALGLGLALPFLLIGFVPALASRLPRPGAWMDTLKTWLAFPMYLTAVWLAWVFGKQRGIDALALLLVGLLLLAIGLWWFERRRYAEGAIKKALAWLFLALAMATLVGALRLANNQSAPAVAEGSVPYSAAKLAELRASGRPVFVDMTADWCITCKVNEKAVLNTDRFRKLLADTNTVYMIGDWTNQDPEISAFLDQYHSPGVPLYVVFPANGGPGKKLPQLLSDRIVRDALQAAK